MLKKNRPNISTLQFSAAVIKLHKKISQEVPVQQNPPVAKTKSYQALKDESPSFQKEMVLFLLEKLCKKQAGFKNAFYSDVNKKLLTLLWRRKLQFNSKELSQMLSLLLLNKPKGLSLTGFLNQVKVYSEDHEISDKIRNQLFDLKIKAPVTYQALKKADQKFNQTIDSLVGQKESITILPTADPLSNEVNAFFNEMEDDDYQLWTPLISVLQSVKSTAVPSKKWISDFEKAITKMDKAMIANAFIPFVQTGIEAIQIYQKTPRKQIKFLSESSITFLKGILWTGGFLDQDGLNSKIEALGLQAYKRIPSFGATSTKLGNACLYVFSLLPFEKGVSKLVKFRHKIASTRVQKLCQKYLEAVAERNETTVDSLEEMAVDDYGLDEKAQIIQSFGDYGGILEVSDIGKVKTTWLNAKGAFQKSIPAAVKKDYPIELAIFKQKSKQITDALSVHKKRIEGSYLKDLTWTFEHWKTYFIDHPLIGLIAKKLIWTFEQKKKKESGIFWKGKFVDVNGKVLKLANKKSKVQLWHPIFEEANTVLAWRDFFESQHIRQAFKQAYREIYLLTDAERNTNTYSNRFAAHILKQRQFSSLCRVRGWKYAIQGEWDTPDNPYIHLPTWDIESEFWINTSMDTGTTSGIYDFIFSDQVRFYEDGEQLELEKVPTIVFSEIMRDVDLFVGVCSIGNDPTWEDTGNEQLDNYWQDFAFGDLSVSAKTRKDALQKLVPKLKIASQCRFDGKFLFVKGSLRTYKIHLGSGNILMSPNDEYLCIVPDARANKEQVFLPFEGDRMLSIILSKAFMLADDTSIKDETIVSQIQL